MIVRNPANLFEKDVVDDLKRISDIPILKGQLIENVALTTTGTKVFHNLGRVPLGFIVVRSTTPVTVNIDTTGNTNEAQFLYLDSTANTTVNLWLF